MSTRADETRAGRSARRGAALAGTPSASPRRPARPDGRARWRFLADAGALLGASLEYEETLAQVARLAVPRFADFTVIDLLDDDGRLAPVAAAHADPARQPLLEALRRHHRGDLGGAHPAAEVLRTGAPLLLPRVGDRFERIVEDAAGRAFGSLGAGAPAGDVANERAGYAAYLAAVRALDTRSYLAVPLGAHGRVFGVLALGMGDSGRRYGRADLALAQEIGCRAALAIAHARLYAEARRAAAARDDVVATVSHDLKNPLHTIQLTAGWLAEVGWDGGESVRLIQRAARRMRVLLDDLLAASALERHQFPLDRAPVDVGGLLAEALEELAAAGAARGLTVAGDVAPGLPPVDADRERLLRVLANVGGNAVKFTPPGGVVTVRAGVRAAAPAPTVVEFAVCDTGPGIAAADLPHVFDRYWQARRTARQGTGLGLAIAKGIVAAHGGEIAVESTPGTGCTVRFTIPAAGPTTAGLGGAAPTAERPSTLLGAELAIPTPTSDGAPGARR